MEVPCDGCGRSVEFKRGIGYYCSSCSHAFYEAAGNPRVELRTATCPNCNTRVKGRIQAADKVSCPRCANEGTVVNEFPKPQAEIDAMSETNFQLYLRGFRLIEAKETTAAPPPSHSPTVSQPPGLDQVAVSKNEAAPSKARKKKSGASKGRSRGSVSKVKGKPPARRVRKKDNTRTFQEIIGDIQACRDYDRGLVGAKEITGRIKHAVGYDHLLAFSNALNKSQLQDRAALAGEFRAFHSAFRDFKAAHQPGFSPQVEGPGMGLLAGASWVLGWPGAGLWALAKGRSAMQQRAVDQAYMFAREQEYMEAVATCEHILERAENRICGYLGKVKRGSLLRGRASLQSVPSKSKRKSRGKKEAVQ